MNRTAIEAIIVERTLAGLPIGGPRRALAYFDQARYECERCTGLATWVLEWGTAWGTYTDLVPDGGPGDSGFIRCDSCASITAREGYRAFIFTSLITGKVVDQLEVETYEHKAS